MSTSEDRFYAMVRRAHRIVAFTGAGISTECGIPDFRSPGGLWTRYRPIPFDEFVRSAAARLEAWRRYFKIRESVDGAKPGRGHRALAHLLALGKLQAIITQNIDNLHQDSGVPASHLIELHGNGSYAKCLSCERRHELAWAKSFVDREARAPECVDCGGPVKTATISFGQPMPEEAMRRASEHATDCDLFLALGSSLTVFPAAGLPMIAAHSGADLVIINHEPTDLDDAATLVIHRDIGDVLEPLLSLTPAERANHP